MKQLAPTPYTAALRALEAAGQMRELVEFIENTITGSGQKALDQQALCRKAVADTISLAEELQTLLATLAVRA